MGTTKAQTRLCSLISVYCLLPLKNLVSKPKQIPIYEQTDFSLVMSLYIPSKKSFAHMGFRLIFVLTGNRLILSQISLFTEIILQQLIEFQTEIQGSLRKLSVFKVSRGHPSKVAKLPKMRLELKTWNT